MGAPLLSSQKRYVCEGMPPHAPVLAGGVPALVVQRQAVPERPPMDHAQRELEAESVAYLVCARNGVTSESEKYLANYVKEHTTIANLDVYQVLRAAGQIETLLGVRAQTRIEARKRRG